MGQRIGRPSKCGRCGSCERCARAASNRAAYQAMTLAERQAWIARRDQEKVKASDRARYRRDHAKRRAANDAYTQANPKPVKAAKAAWAVRNPEKIEAQRIARSAIRSGSLQQGPCESAGPECTDQIHAHHDDYSKPLEVRWLCTWHHAAHHVEVRGLS